MPVDRRENLKPITTVEEAREKGRRGGIASGKARKEQKFFASIYAEVLADKYEVSINGNKEKIDGVKLVKIITRDVLLRRDSASVAMLREMREGNDKLDGRKQDEGLVIIIDGEDVIASTDKQTIPS